MEFFQAIAVMFFTLCALNLGLGILMSLAQIMKHLRDDE